MVVLIAVRVLSVGSVPDLSAGSPGRARRPRGGSLDLPRPRHRHARSSRRSDRPRTQRKAERAACVISRSTQSVTAPTVIALSLRDGAELVPAVALRLAGLCRGRASYRG